MAKIGDLMTRNPICCGVGDTLQDCARIMAENKVGALPVCDQNKTIPVGLVTDRDLCVRGLGKGLTPDRKVSEVMSRECLCMSPEESLEKAVEKMVKHKIRRIIICDETKKAVGVLALTDIALKSKDDQLALRALRGASSHYVEA